MHNTNPWWGEFTFAEHHVKHWSIGNRKVIVQRMRCEWNIWNIESDSEEHERLVYGDLDESYKPDNGSLSRYIQTKTGEKILILPALADRSIVARPSVPLTLLGGEHTLIYVSTPLWFRVSILPEQLCIADIPFWRPSDSWFGNSTREGEICYAKYTEARLSLNLSEQPRHRVITPVRIHNEHKNALQIERLNVPVPLLNLYNDQNRQFWSDAIRINRKGEDNIVDLVLEKQTPSEAQSAVKVSNPRVVTEKHILSRALSSLFA